MGESHLSELTQRLRYSSPKDLKIAYLNVCGVRNKLEEIRCLQQFCKFEILGFAFYLTVILPTVTYGLALWGCCSNQELPF